MTLQDAVQERVSFIGCSVSGSIDIIHSLLEHGRDILQFMDRNSSVAVNEFYHQHQEEIDILYNEDMELLLVDSCRNRTRLAVEKTLILIEEETKNDLARV